MCDRCFPLFFLKSCHHLPDPTVFATRCKDFQALFLRSPLQNIDVYVADAPAFHFQPARLVQVDGVSANKGPSIIVNNVFLVCGGDAKPRAEWIARPIGSCTQNVSAGKMSANCIVGSASFTVRVGSSPHVRYVARATKI